MDNRYPFVLPPLPYAYDALEPDLDARLLRYHHDKHFGAAVDNLNALLAPYPVYQSWTLRELCLNWAQLPDEIAPDVRNNAGSVFNHTLYFERLHPLPPSAPSAPLEGAITRTFGGMDGLYKAMKGVALSVFGSGWAVLAVGRDGNLTILKTKNQDTVLPLEPVLCCDMWEHAYYLQYQNRRKEYFNAWWRLIDWPNATNSCKERINGLPAISYV